MKTLYSKIITEEIIRLQAHGFSAEETRDYLQKEYDIRPALNTIYKHRRSPVGVEMLQELIRQQERDILKSSTENRALALKYRSDLIGKLMDKLLPDLANIETSHTERIEEIKVLWLKNESNPADKILSP